MKIITLNKVIDFKKYALKRCKIVYCKGENFLKGVEGIILPFVKEFGRKKVMCCLIVDKNYFGKDISFEKGDIIFLLKGDKIKIL